jgi:hypothetical protein
LIFKEKYNFLKVEKTRKNSFDPISPSSKRFKQVNVASEQKLEPIRLTSAAHIAEDLIDTDISVKKDQNLYIFPDIKLNEQPLSSKSNNEINLVEV